MDDIDFKSKVTRSEFEELCADLFERVPRPVEDALAVAEMNLVSCTFFPFKFELVYVVLVKWKM